VDLTGAALISAEERMVRDTTIAMPRVLHKELKKIAVDRDSSVNILVNPALPHWLAKKGALRLGMRPGGGVPDGAISATRPQTSIVNA